MIIIKDLEPHWRSSYTLSPYWYPFSSLLCALLPHRFLLSCSFFLLCGYRVLPCSIGPGFPFCNHGFCRAIILLQRVPPHHPTLRRLALAWFFVGARVFIAGSRWLPLLQYFAKYDNPTRRDKWTLKNVLHTLFYSQWSHRKNNCLSELWWSRLR
jgi:hypothetical protein